ncbi:hypothetical protein DXG03_000026 [Asterophora parasitica]|uniref:Phosphoribosyltransferase domain-containing protein n=1 Tax=Asterophora parasitica TaxID=117018 RepID=A0A9P7GG36_9AGAR|nr:hypothetical protein DXG03_000026 [Asterophora parasitica]
MAPAKINVLSHPLVNAELSKLRETKTGPKAFRELPPSPPVDEVFLLDPLIATGGTACAALAMIVDWGIPVDRVKLLCVLGSREGLAHVQAEYPTLDIWVAGIDENLTSEGIISPGLGDTGDRLFSTIRA